MKTSEHILKFPKDSGFKETLINFNSGNPDFIKEFIEKAENTASRLFITDTSIAQLELLKPLINYFEKEESISKEIVFQGKKGNDFLCIINAGEAYKSIESVLAIVKLALEKNFNRNATFISIGGGVISDLTGFAASIYKRGISCQFIPTTLLAMVDASVGGKTGCDFSNYKNMIGTFYPASVIHIYPSFIKTLPENEYRSGLGEAIKTAFLFNKEMTKLFETQADKIMQREEKVLEKIIEGCVKAKACVVEKDFKEKNERALLNYGHTFGHALETCAGLGKVTHGEAVVWGIGRAIALAEKKGSADKTFISKAKKILSSFNYSLEPLACDLLNFKSAEEKNLFSKKLLEAMRKDKKNLSSKKIRIVYQNDFCDNVIEEFDENTIAEVLK